MKKQIVFLMTDTTRKDMVGCYGNPKMKTPNLDRLAEEGIRYENAYTCQPVCGPARSAIFTGTFPHSNGMVTNSVALGANVKTVGQRLNDYKVPCGYVGKWHLDGGDYFGLGTCPEGWDTRYWYDMRCYLEELSEQDRVKSRNPQTSYGDDFDVLFGPAYKGIPLGVVTAIAYSELYGKEVRYCSDRKEEKDHGADKGSFLGSKLKDGDRVIMIEDVTTSGKSMEETVPKVKGAADVTIVGLMVSLNRMEVGKGGEKCALDEVKDLYGFETAAIVTMEDVVECLYNKECDGKVVIDDELKAAIDAYYEKYGAK